MLSLPSTWLDDMLKDMLTVTDTSLTVCWLILIVTTVMRSIPQTAHFACLTLMSGLAMNMTDIFLRIELKCEMKCWSILVLCLLMEFLLLQERFTSYFLPIFDSRNSELLLKWPCWRFIAHGLETNANGWTDHHMAKEALPTTNMVQLSTSALWLNISQKLTASLHLSWRQNCCLFISNFAEIEILRDVFAVEKTELR